MISEEALESLVKAQNEPSGLTNSIDKWAVAKFRERLSDDKVENIEIVDGVSGELVVSTPMYCKDCAEIEAVGCKRWFDKWFDEMISDVIDKIEDLKADGYYIEISPKIYINRIAYMLEVMLHCNVRVAKK